jgi:hypothetical protein
MPQTTKKLGPTQQIVVDAIGDRIVEREALLSQWTGAERAKMRKALTRLCADNVIAYDDLDGEIHYRINMKIADGVAVIASAPRFEPPAVTACSERVSAKTMSFSTARDIDRARAARTHADPRFARALGDAQIAPLSLRRRARVSPPARPAVVVTIPGRS